MVSIPKSFPSEAVCWFTRQVVFRAVAVAVLLLPLVVPAHAGLVVENFDSPIGADGRVLFNAITAYDGITDSEAVGVSGGDFNGNSLLNGEITKTDGFAGGISKDQSGSGYFLLENTGGASTPAGMVWGSSTSVAVSANTTYLFSFYLTNQNTIANAEIEAFINGVSLGSLAFIAFVGVPRVVLYDNLKGAVLQRQGDAIRFNSGPRDGR